jgi:hypothetical protein
MEVPYGIGTLVDRATYLHQFAGFIEAKLQVAQQNSCCAVFLCFDHFGGLAESRRIRREGRITAGVGGTGVRGKKEQTGAARRPIRR